MSARTIAFVGYLVDPCPFLLVVYMRYVADHDWTLRADPAMEEIARWVEAARSSGSPEAEKAVRRLLDILEDNMQGHSEIRDLITRSFLKKLAPWSGPYDDFGPLLKAQRQAIDESLS